MTAATTWDERAPATRASAAHFVWIAFAVLAIASFAVPRWHDSQLAQGNSAAVAARIGQGNLELHEVAGGRRNLRPVHLQGGNARGQRLPQCAADRGDRDLLDRALARKRLDGGAARAAIALDRRGRGRGRARLSLRGHASCAACGRRLPLPRRVRPMGKRHDDARLDRDCRAARRGRRRAVRHPRLPRSNRATDHGADPRSHADGADLRLSHTDPVSVRLRTGGGADRDHDLCHAANGARDHDGAGGRAARDRRVRHHGRHHAMANAVQGHASRGAAAAARRRQSGHHALAQHGDHRLDDRRRRPRL